MTREEIIQYVVQAGLQEIMTTTGPEKLENFARLIAGAEQERCFNVCGQVEGPNTLGKEFFYRYFLLGIGGLSHWFSS